MADEAKRVLLIENDGGMIRSVKSAIDEDPGLRFVGYLTGRTNLDAYLDEYAPDIALVDIGLMRPGEGMQVRLDEEDHNEGLWIIERIDRISPHTKVIGFSNYLTDKDKPLLARRALECGAEAVIAKQNAPAEWSAWCTWLRSQIRAVLDGWWRPSPEVAQLLMAELDERPDEPLPLTARQMEVLRHLASGRTENEMAELLCIEPGAVRGHISNIRKRMGMRYRWQIVEEAVRRGIVGDECA
jgi:DNA-binding NarL/FixJ family response regulator